MLQTSSTGQPRRSRRAAPPSLAPMFVALSLAMPSLAHAAGPLPSGGHFVAGTGSINGNATSLTVDQTSNRGVIDWTRFSIGNGNHVSILNGNGATLNRVTGADPSSILGELSATGTVYLINPQGIVIGPSGVVSTGGRFVATSLDTDDASFMNGGPLTLSTPLSRYSGAPVVNLGKIASSGGDVFLIGGSVVNLGAISAPKGTAELAAGATVLLQDSSTSRQVFVQEANLGTVLTRGAIEAAQIDLQAADGNVFALAGNHYVLRATGTTERDGHIWLIAPGGNVTFDGTIEARNANGSGGTVDSSAANVVIADDANAKSLVKAGQWNIAAPSFAIDGLTAPVLRRSLNTGTSINVQATGATSPFGTTMGDIDVASSLHWFGAASLTLAAYHSITIEAAAKLKNCGTGNLTLRADSTAIDNGGSVTNNGTIDWSASKGIVSAFYDMNGTYAPGKLLANKAWSSPTYSGLVTQITGYKLVNSLADLENVNADLAGNYALGKDIDASATGTSSYTPIGSEATPFTGQFDGEGHSISSLAMGAASGPYPATPVALGMFGTLGASAVVRDLSVNGSEGIASAVPTQGTSGDEGILAGHNYGTIVGVSTSGTIGWGGGATDSTMAGGLVGVNFGTIARSSSSVSGSTGGTLAGLVGVNSGVISQSFASGSLNTYEIGPSGFGLSAGSTAGLVGTNNGTIMQSYATGAVQTGCVTLECSAAGLVLTNTGTITQSFATGSVTGGHSYTGSANYGIAAVNSGTIANDVYWNKNTTTTAIGVGSGTPIPASNGLTTAQMSNLSSFAGWNFGATGAWDMPAGASHPILRWQVEQ
jgi:filamentous hemagglutinin family protein